MNKNSLIKWAIFAGLVAASAVVVTPIKEKIRLGLDLSGGTSFTVQIDEDELREDKKAANPDASDGDIQREIDAILQDADNRTVEVLRNRIDALGVNEPVIVPSSDHRIIIEIPGIDDVQRKHAEDSIKSAAFLRFRLVHPQNSQLVSKLFSQNKAPEGYEIADGSSQAYKRAANFAEVSKRPGYKRDLAKWNIPKAGYVFMLEQDKDGATTVYHPVFVRNKDELTGSELKNASISTDPMSGKIGVSLEFKTKGANEFARLTEAWCPNGTKQPNNPVGRQLAIILDDILYSAPVLTEPIPSGRAQISGSFTLEDALILRNILNAGSLPAPIKILEKRSISPSLGESAINSGIRASIIGGSLVVLFMLFYYCFYGIVADIALLFNIYLLPLGMIIVSGVFSALGATDTPTSGLQLPVLTMPGIAGIVLTIGMAVDANVLIFERIREEMNSGKTPLVAINAGYDRAFLAIFDSNLTTFLTAVILFLFGSGPIRGFAITLSAGIIVNMYTALVLTRMLFTAFVSDQRRTHFKMNKLFKKPLDLPILSKAKSVISVSVAIIVISLGIFAFNCVKNPRKVMSIDFTGGTTMSYTFAKDKAPTEPELLAALKAGDVDDAVIQVQKALDDVPETYIVKTGYDETPNTHIKVNDAIASAVATFTDAGATNVSSDTIGSQIGSDLKRDATKAVIWSLVMMIIYITIRFEFGFSLGAVVALAHDVLITLGLYTLFGRQVGVTAIACLLTIVGYSVNDTIVVFDRIREDLRKNPTANFKDLCNSAINQTLSRTLLTSVTTLLACLSLFVFGGGAIFDFALCMLIGVVVGTYSSIFIATPAMLAWYNGKRPQAFLQKESAEG